MIRTFCRAKILLRSYLIHTLISRTPQIIGKVESVKKKEGPIVNIKAYVYGNKLILEMKEVKLNPKNINKLAINQDVHTCSLLLKWVLYFPYGRLENSNNLTELL
jgi:hypothetical protein